MKIVPSQSTFFRAGAHDEAESLVVGASAKKVLWLGTRCFGQASLTYSKSAGLSSMPLAGAAIHEAYLPFS